LVFFFFFLLLFCFAVVKVGIIYNVYELCRYLVLCFLKSQITELHIFEKT
jgi:hypothetical protein